MVVYIKTFVHLQYYLGEPFSEWKIFQRYREKQSTRFAFSDFSETCAAYEITWKSMIQPQKS